MKSAFLLACTFALFAAFPAFADTYTYTGNDFTQVYGTGYTTSDYIHGTIDTSTALMPGQTYYLFSLPAFSFTDGLQTIDQTNATGVDFFILAIDAHGIIFNWDFYIENSQGAIGSCAGSGPAGHCVPAPVDFSALYPTPGGGSVTNNPGTWAGPVPEPSSFWLMALGAVAVIGKMARPQVQ